MGKKDKIKKAAKVSDEVFDKINRRKIITNSQKLIWVYTINGAIWVYMSYLLAWTGRENIAEALSQTVCTVILGQIGFYLVTKTVENIFRYNDNIGGKSTYPADIEIREELKEAYAAHRAESKSKSDDDTGSDSDGGDQPGDAPSGAEEDGTGNDNAPEPEDAGIIL